MNRLTCLLLAALIPMAGSASAQEWSSVDQGDKLGGGSSPAVMAHLTADDGHRFEVTAACHDGPPGWLGIELLSLDKDAKFKQEQAAFQTVFVTRTRIDGGAIHSAQAKVDYDNDQVVIFLNAVPDGGFFEKMFGGMLVELSQGSTLRLEPTMIDGAQPLLTVSLTGRLKTYINSCYAALSRSR